MEKQIAISNIYIFLISLTCPTYSGVRQQNDSLLMIYYHDQAVAIGEFIFLSMLLDFIG